MLAWKDNSTTSQAQFCELHLIVHFDVIKILEAVHSQIISCNFVAEPGINCPMSNDLLFHNYLPWEVNQGSLIEFLLW